MRVPFLASPAILDRTRLEAGGGNNRPSSTSASTPSTRRGQASRPRRPNPSIAPGGGTRYYGRRYTAGASRKPDPSWLSGPCDAIATLPRYTGVPAASTGASPHRSVPPLGLQVCFACIMPLPPLRPYLVRASWSQPRAANRGDHSLQCSPSRVTAPRPTLALKKEDASMPILVARLHSPLPSSLLSKGGSRAKRCDGHERERLMSWSESVTLAASCPPTTLMQSSRLVRALIFHDYTRDGGASGLPREP